MPESFPVFFIGVKRVGAVALNTLCDQKVPIAFIITMPGQDNHAIVEQAEKSGIPYYIDPPFNEKKFLDEIRSYGSERGVCFSFPKRIPGPFLELFRFGIINFHPAKLPDYRGCFPTIWPILNGDQSASYTMHVMDEQFDTGDIIAATSLPVMSDDTGFSLYERLVDVIPALLQEFLPALHTSVICGTPQLHEKGNYYSRSLPNQGLIDWAWSKQYIIRFVRALSHPFHKGAIGRVAAKDLEILGVSLAGAVSGQVPRPGTFLRVGEDLNVACKDGWLRITKIRDMNNKIREIDLGRYFEEYFQ